MRLRLFQIILIIIAFAMCFIWYDWKLFVIIFLLQWADNLDKVNIKKNLYNMDSFLDNEGDNDKF
jgi:hypothetical protein